MSTTLWRTSIGFGLAFLLLLSSCACRIPAKAMEGGHTRMVRTQLYFGNLGPGLEWISENEWDQFVKEQVEPAFPAGFTVLRGDGHWLDQSGRAVNEAVHVLIIIHPTGQPYFDLINEVIATYKLRYHQEAVMQISEKVKVGFHP